MRKLRESGQKRSARSQISPICINVFLLGDEETFFRLRQPGDKKLSQKCPKIFILRLYSVLSNN